MNKNQILYPLTIILRQSWNWITPKRHVRNENWRGLNNRTKKFWALMVKIKDFTLALKNMRRPKPPIRML